MKTHVDHVQSLIAPLLEPLETMGDHAFSRRAHQAQILIQAQQIVQLAGIRDALEQLLPKAPQG